MRQQQRRRTRRKPPQWIAPVLIALGIVVAIGAVAAGTIALGGGDDAPPTADGDTPTAASPTPDEFGPEPELGGNVLEVTPAHGSRVTQQSTRSPDPARPNGVCAQVSFEGLPENAQWFRMAVDNTEVTGELVWVVANQDAPEGGRVCFAPVTGLSPGRHAALLRVSDPRNPAAAPKQTVVWAFEVVP